MSKIFIIAGRAGSGKTTFCKEHIYNFGLNVLFFDLYNYEYKDLPEIETQGENAWQVNGKMKYTGDVDLLISSVGKLRNCTLVVEDSTVFFGSRLADDVSFKKAIYGRRHKNINLVFLFHAVNRITVGIMEQANYLVLFKTNDVLRVVSSKYQNRIINAALQRVEKSNDPHYNEIIKLA